MNDKLRTIHLYGSLREKYGSPYEMSIETSDEAVRALSSQIDGFYDTIREGNWKIIKGDVEEGESLDEESLTMTLGGVRELHIIPVLEGAGDDGVGKVLAGAALVGLAFTGVGAVSIAALGTTTGSIMGSIGISMALGGISQLLTPTPSTGDYGERESPDERPSYMFNGPVNTSTQGLPVPVGYGRMKVGSVVVSSGISVEELEE